MSQRVTVHDPRGYPPKVVGKRLAPRPPSIEGKTVYLVDCRFDNSDVFTEQLRQWFAEHLPGVTTRTIQPSKTWSDDEEMRARIRADGNAAILGVGRTPRRTCTACSRSATGPTACRSCSRPRRAWRRC